MEFEVTDTQRAGELIVHIGKLKSGKLVAGLVVTAEVDTDRRLGIQRAHSATHILHHALQQVLGNHAQQQGSKVDNDWLRFDFTNLSSLTDDQVQQIEEIVADRVRAAEPIVWNTVSLSDARKAGAMMLFGEKYPDPVRMVSMGDFSKELCGGTHLNNTSEVLHFEVSSEEGIAAGTRRIEALTGSRAATRKQEVRETLQQAADALGCDTGDVVNSLKNLMLSVRGLKKQLDGGPEYQAERTEKSVGGVTEYLLQRHLLRDASRMLNVSSEKLPERIAALKGEHQKLLEQIETLRSSGDISVESLMERGESIGGTLVLVAETPGANPNLMRRWIEQIRQKSSSPAAVLLATRVGEDKVMLVAGISRSLVDQGVSAAEWIGRVAPCVGGGGGGKPDFAQAGGKQPEQMPEALKVAKESILQLLQTDA
jgi:alanyl-tRNA synthetase